MAGEGSRFREQGYSTPKPFIEVEGKTLVEIVLQNLTIANARYILLARAEHLRSESSAVTRIRNQFDAEFVSIDQHTEGAACTVLFAHRLINNETPLLIANSDQYVNFNVSSYIEDCISRKLDGSILTFVDAERNPKWSFAKTDPQGLVTEVQEKRPISEFATAGLYFFSKGQSFVENAIDLVIHNDRVNNEFYVCPVYNYCIRQNLKIGIYNICQEDMFDMGTPQALQHFMEFYRGRC